MTNNIWFKIIAGKINKIPQFYTIFARKMPDYIIWQRDRGQAEAKTSRPRPRPKLQGRGRGPLWPRGLNIIGVKTWDVHGRVFWWLRISDKTVRKICLLVDWQRVSYGTSHWSPTMKMMIDWTACQVPSGLIAGTVEHCCLVRRVQISSA